MTEEDLDLIVKYRRYLEGEEYIVKIFEDENNVNETDVYVAYSDTGLLYTARSVETVRSKRNMT